MLKKIALFSGLVLSFSLFSCASKPKLNEQDSVIEEISSVTNAPEEAEKDLPVSKENTAAPSDDYSDLEEPVTPEQTDILPELPAEKTEKVSAAQEEPAVIKEPEVKDEPVPSVEEKKIALEKKTEASGMLDEEKNNSAEKDASAENKTDADTKAPSSEPENNTIEEIDDSSTVQEEKTEPGKVEIMPNPSRSITIQKNQLIDIIYPGKGWIYQGNIDEEGNIDSRNRNFVFGGRKLGGSDTAFTLRSRNSGTFILHFYKNDTLTGNYIDDYLEVIVQNKAANTTEHVLAPSYAEVVPPKASITAEKIKEEKKQKLIAEEKAKQAEQEEKNQAAKKAAVPAKTTQNATAARDSAIDTIIQTSESAPKNDSPVVKNDKKDSEKQNPAVKNTPAKEAAQVSSENFDEQNAEQLLSTAKKYYDSKEYPKAYSAISKFFDKASSRLDEGLYLRGQILEEKSSVQNIKNAIESYDLVVKNYPASSLWEKASKRSIFLKRFYINIR